ncbi:MAG: hypothetical protein J6S97_10180 [Bacteroidales bacterium]|nr:hypothetical protein [Bacteroidales bacterium]
MKKQIALLLLAATLVLTSCGASKFYAGKAADIAPIALVSPYSHLTDAVGDFQTDYVEGPSLFNQQLISEAVSQIGLPVSKTVGFDYKKQDAAISTWMLRLSEIGAARAKDLEVPTQIVEAVKKSGCDYGLLITDVGYVKNIHEYQAELALESSQKVLGLLKNGELDLSKDTEACMSGVFSVIFDSRTGKPVWFGSLPRSYKNNPIDSESIIQQMEKLFKDFLK